MGEIFEYFFTVLKFSTPGKRVKKNEGLLEVELSELSGGV